MNLHDAIKNYIHELQDLLQETDEGTLLDKAAELWGEDDSRYEVLEKFVESPSSSESRFNKQPKPPAPEPSHGSDPTLRNKPVK